MGLAFRLYAYIWTGVLILYSLNWSAFTSPLDKELLCFLIVTVVVSFVIGIKDSKLKFDGRKVRINRYNGLITFFVIAGYCVNFLYSSQVPFINVIMGKGSYVDVPGISGLYPLVLTFSLFWFIYLLYCREFCKKNYILQITSIALCFVLVFSRIIIMCAIIGYMIIVYLSRIRLRVSKRLKVGFFKYFVLICAILIALFLFGALGNVRQGYSWRDCSYIEDLGKFENYPQWLPKQFMWAYLYIITPLANLNYNIVAQNHIFDAGGFFASLCPEFIGQHMFNLDFFDKILLIEEYFNAPTAFAEAYYNLGVFGLYLYYTAFLLVYSVLRVLWKNQKYNLFPIITFSIFVGISFFYNVFYYSLTSMMVIYTVAFLLTGSYRKRSKGKTYLEGTIVGQHNSTGL